MKLSRMEFTQYLTICDQLRENRTNCQLLRNKIAAHKVNAVIIAVGNQIFFFFTKNLNPHYFLNMLVNFYILKENFN